MSSRIVPTHDGQRPSLSSTSNWQNNTVRQGSIWYPGQKNFWEAKYYVQCNEISSWKGQQSNSSVPSIKHIRRDGPVYNGFVGQAIPEPNVVPVVVEEDSAPPVDFEEYLNWTIRRKCDDVTINFARGTMGELQRELQDLKATRIRGPKLSRIFDFLKSIQVTSVESERSFSVSGRFLNKLQCKMGDLTVGALALLHYFFKNK